MEEKKRYCNYYNCWCNDVDVNVGEECNYRCNKCPYSEYKEIGETFYTE